MQAIHTYYMPPTNERGSQIKAKCGRGSLSVGFHSVEAAHDDDKFAIVARMLCDKFVAEDLKEYGKESLKGNPWARPFVTGGFPGGGYVHVFTPKK